ncbi:MAG: hypothetical protein Q9M92_02840 [Enterobacterales bacterium]|nr:hypothetical protein [Enterobacterales bacterium]
MGFPFALFFAWVFEITPQGIKRETEVDGEQSVVQSSGRKIDLLVILLLTLVLGYMGYDKWFASNSGNDLAQTTEPQEADAAQALAVIPVAVLPFINLSQDKNQEYFVDGLTEELLNSLTRIKGLKVTGRTSSFEFKGKNIDLREIAKQLNVDYLVEGSVRKQGDNLRITMQLIEAKSGSHILSKNFDRKLKDVFQLQEDVANQVAAALNLSLVLNNEQYNSALSKLDYLSVVKLVESRAQLNEFNEESSSQALATLSRLNQAYPDTPEILGLLSRAAMISSSVGGEELVTLQNKISTAKKALLLDPKNIDALYTLAVIYKDSPHLLVEAKKLFQQLIRFYPANEEYYYRYAQYLMSISSSCESLRDYFGTIPTGVLSAERKASFEFVILQCFDLQAANRKLLNAENTDFAAMSLYFTSGDYNIQYYCQRNESKP